MVKIAILNFVFFVVGVVLGFTFGSKQAEETPPAPVVTPAAAAPAAKQAKVTEVVEVPDGTRRTLSAALAAIPAETVASGTGSITGRVTSEDGRPVPGVVVRATRARERSRSSRKRGSGAPADADLEKEVLELVTRHRWRQASTKEGRSDAKGAYVVRGLADAEYRLAAYAKGYEIRRKTHSRNRGVKPGTTIDFVAAALVDVPVKVTFAGGGEPARARIEWRRTAGGEERSSSEAWSPATPSIRLNTGTFTLKATASADGEEYRSEEREVTLAAGETPAALSFQLKGRTGVKGRVLFAQGEVMENVRVYVLAAPSGEPPAIKRPRNAVKEDWVHKHNNYEFTFRDLAPGKYYLAVARRYNGPVVAGEIVEVTDHMITRDLSIPPLEPWQYVLVWVYGPGNELIRDASISTGRRSDHGSSSGGGTVIKRDDGAYLVMHHERDDDEENEEDLSAYRYYVSVSTKKYGKKEVEYERGPTSEVTVQFVEPATLDVTIAGYVGSGQEGQVRLSLAEADDGARGSPVMHSSSDNQISADGHQAFGPVEPGEYEIVVLARTERHSQIEVDRVPVLLRAGANLATVGVPELYSLTVLVTDAPPNARLRLQPVPRRRGGWYGAGQKVDKDGRAEFTNLPAGEYRLRMDGPTMGGIMNVNIPGDREVQFQPKPINALAVTVDDPEGFLAQAGFQSGDVIIAIDGKQFDDMFQLQSAFAGSMSKEEVALTVVRGGREVTFTMNFRKVMEQQGKMGGDFEPTSR